MKKSILLSFLLLAVSFLTINCSKEGPVGPAGVTGAAGPAGPAGPTGPTGASSVIYSPWFTSSVAWTTPGLSSSDYSFDRAAPGITQTILDNGVVMSYVKLSTEGSVVRTLPTTAFNINGFHFYNFLMPSVSTIRYTYIFTDNPDIPTTTTQFRYIIIPGGVAGGRLPSGASHNYSAEQLRGMSYEDVIKLFNIPADGKGGY